MDNQGGRVYGRQQPGVSTSFSPQIGERFAGRYELKSPLRADGALQAFLAFDHHAGLDVALLLFDSACAHPIAWSAFARIVGAATAAKIAGLVLPQGVAPTPPVPPFCLAEPLALRGFDRLRDQGPMPWQRALTLGERATEILQAAHAATGVAHRVLTPSRCAVTMRDDVRVLDFGVAELELGRPEGAGYRAPEQQQGGGDARSDVYTLAVILFELISGQKSAGKPPPRLRSLVAVPRPVDEFMAKALSQDSAQRPDLGAMRASLRELLGVAAAPAEPTLPPGPKPGASPVSIISAPPEASVVSPATAPERSKSAVGPGPAPTIEKASPARPPALSALSLSSPSPPKPEVVSPRPRQAAAQSDGLPSLPELQESDGPGLMVHGLEDRTEKLDARRYPAPAADDRTEVLAAVSLRAPAVADRTEALAAASLPKREDPERTEMVRLDVPTVQDEETTAFRRPLKGLLAALASSKASAADPVATPLAVTGDDAPTEKSVKLLSLADRTRLSSSEPPAATVASRPNAEVRPSPEPARPVDVTSRPAPEALSGSPEPAGLKSFEVQPAAEDRPAPGDQDEATTVFTPVQVPASPKPAVDPLKKALIWINVVCFAAFLLAMLWLLIA
ncbi:serine/threonine protein kinase [Nannocystis punicea]|uniref:Protein kinase domain-containing protein n=1 Tax=Nannocystis punicea TaxID=2995304 RepID=A0ABY7HC72_9BACT|nr:hypothetical protein [Nannocystis poenicansa]WAS96594.1 hypothetical protein O0S08_10590 [Nannocystis poenicansa]